MKKIALLLLLLAEAACGSLCAQNFEIKDDNLRVASLDGLWRFHTGDNPAWADPNFDDSKWSLLRSDEDWAQQGYKGYGGLAWYRFQVTIPAGLNQISLYLPHIISCYEVYADGKLIGTRGEMPPNTRPFAGGSRFQIYTIPVQKRHRDQIQIALRVWLFPRWALVFGGGPQNGGGLVGDSQDLEHRNALEIDSSSWSNTAYGALALLEALTGFGALALFLLRRGEPEYLWFSLTMLLASATQVLQIVIDFSVWDWDLWQILENSAMYATFLAVVIFYQLLLKPARRWPLKLAAASIVLQVPLFYLRLFLIPSITGLTQLNRINCALGITFYGCILFTILVRARQGSLDARLLIAPVVLTASQLMFGYWGALVNNPNGLKDLTQYTFLTQKPFPILYSQVTDALFLLSVFGILIFRFTRTRSQEERFSAEVQAARSAQQFLIPEQLPLTPGLTIESVYRPAREVGGDFFQVIPDEADDSVLIVVGDVAGHGMEAGMMATLIVGGIRMAAIFTTEPERILALLNKRMRGRGLATCLALRIESDGSATLANAGHLPPYLNGQELEMEGALPLGAVAGITFPLLHFKLAVSDTLMLMTDGLAEAQDTEGHLFGFERIAELLRSHTSAAALATAAQNFGQEDDITILAMSYVGVPASS
jgi:phosphoserine phosphatase RsbU/P